MENAKLVEIKKKVKTASRSLEPIIDQIGAHAEGLALSTGEAAECEKRL